MERGISTTVVVVAGGNTFRSVAAGVVAIVVRRMKDDDFAAVRSLEDRSKLLPSFIRRMRLEVRAAVTSESEEVHVVGD